MSFMSITWHNFCNLKVPSLQIKGDSPDLSQVLQVPGGRTDKRRVQYTNVTKVLPFTLYSYTETSSA